MGRAVDRPMDTPWDRTMTPEQQLRHKLRKIEALFAGGATEGERLAAELHRIALADDPMKELKRIRKMADKRAMKHREKKKSAALHNGGATGKVTDDMDDEQKRLIDWAISAPLNQISEVLSYIRRFDDDAAIADAEESPELAVS